MHILAIIAEMLLSVTITGQSGPGNNDDQRKLQFP